MNKLVNIVVSILLSVNLMGCTFIQDGSPASNLSPTSLSPTETGIEGSSMSDKLGFLSGPFSGFYLLPEIYFQGDQGGARISSELPCNELLDVLAAGEWRLVDRVIYPGLAGVNHFALLVRGNQQIFINAIGTTLGSMPFSTGEIASGQPNSESNQAAPSILFGQEEGDQSFFRRNFTESCAAVLLPVSTQEVVARGAVQADGEARLLPLGCYSSAGQVSLNLFFEGPGDFRATLNLDFPYAVGEHKLDAELLELTIVRSNLSFFDAYQQPPDSGEDTIDQNSTQVGIERLFYPGDSYTGTVRIISLSPIQGVVQLLGMLDDDEFEQNFSSGFTCNLVALPEPVVDLEDIKISSVGMSIEMDYDMGDMGGGFTLSGQVSMNGEMRAIANTSYEGEIQAAGSGIISGFNSNTGNVCANNWQGIQRIKVKGRVLGDSIQLRFEPAGKADVNFESDCGTDDFTGAILPHDNAILNGDDVLVLKWPPGTTDTDLQDVKIRIEGSTINFGNWVVKFNPSP